MKKETAENLGTEAKGVAAPLWFGEDLRAGLASVLAEKFSGKELILISDPAVFSLYGAEIRDLLQAAGHKVRPYLTLQGEKAKDFSAFAALADQILADGLTRQAGLIALGGGVTGDVAGFAAGILLRGIPYLQIPTTLLAQIDSSVGGKTAINSKAGKNLIGLFNRAEAVLIKPGFLKTLPLREFMAGFAEMTKYGLALDTDFFLFLEKNGREIIKGPKDSPLLAGAIQKCCALKTDIVSRDPWEKTGLRQVLNFGHTLGHGFEAASQPTETPLLHGEAVALGMIGDFYLAEAAGVCKGEDKARAEAFYRQTGLLLTHPLLQDPDFLTKAVSFMLSDKKNTGPTIKTLLPCGIGQVREAEYTVKELNNALRRCFAA